MQWREKQARLFKKQKECGRTDEDVYKRQGLGCLAFWVFQKSKTGVMMKVSGMNPMFGRSIGIDNDRMRVMGTILSTICGAIGIVVYAQGIGMYQLYTAPRNMACLLYTSRMEIAWARDSSSSPVFKMTQQ